MLGRENDIKLLFFQITVEGSNNASKSVHTEGF